MGLFSKHRTPNEPGATPKERNKVPIGSGLMSLPLLGGAAWGLHRTFGPFGNIAQATGIIGEDNYLKDMVRVGKLVSAQSIGYTYADNHMANVNALTDWHSKSQAHAHIPGFDRIVELSWRQAAAKTSHSQKAINRFASNLRNSVQKDMVLSAAMTRAQKDGVLDAFTKSFMANMGGLMELSPSPAVLDRVSGRAIPSKIADALIDKGPTSTALGRINKKRQELLNKLTGDLANIPGVTVGGIKILERQGLQTAFLGVRFKSGKRTITQEFQVPFDMKGKIAVGKNMSTFYTAGRFVDKPGGVMKGVSEQTASLIIKASQEISNAFAQGSFTTRDARAITRQHMNQVLKDERLQWVPGPMRGIKANNSVIGGLQSLPPGLKLTAALETLQVNFTGKVDAQSLEDLSSRFYPHTSAQALSKGRLLTKNLVGDLPFGDRYHAARSPLQWIRDTGPTLAARKWMDRYKGVGPNYGTPFVRTTGTLGSLIDKFGYRAPSVPTVFVREGLLQATKGASGALLMSPEEIMIKDVPHLRKMYEQERLLATKKISLEAGSIHAALAKALEDPASMLGTKLRRGSFLGLEAGTGNKLLVPDRPYTENVIAGLTVSEDKKTLELQIKQLQRLHSGSKFFSEGSTVKGVTSVQSNAAFNRVGSELGINRVLEDAGLKGMKYEQIASSAHVLKTRGAISRSVITGIGYIVSEKLSRGEYVKTRDLERVGEFLADPMNYMKARNLLDDVEVGGESVSEFKMLRHAKQAFKFNPAQVGLAGGALEGQLAKTKAFSKAERFAISRGYFFGETTAYQDWLEPGTQGSLEPRVLRQLMARGDQYGQVIAKNLAGRIDDPYRITGMQNIHRILSDFTSDEKSFQAPTLSYKDIDAERLQQGGFYLDTGRKVEAFMGKSSVYVPTPEELFYMGHFRSKGDALTLSEGRVLPKHIQGRYLSMFRALSDDMDQATVQESFNKHSEGLVRALYGQSRNYARLGGKLLGSTRGTALAAHYGVIPKGEVGDFGYLARADAERMIKEVMSSTRYQGPGKRELYRQLKTTGIEGMVWRHPAKDVFSQQPIRWKMSSRLKAGQILLPQFGSEDVNVPGIGNIPISKSRMVGLEGDYDADALEAALMFDDESRQAIAGQLDSGAFQREYFESQKRIGAIKRAVKDNLGKQDIFDALPDLGAQAKMHGQAKVVTGPISAALSRLNLATALHAPKSYNHFAQLAGVLEQVAISGKKGYQASEELVESIKGLSYNPSELNESLVQQQMENLLGPQRIGALKESGLLDVRGVIGEAARASKAFKGTAAERQYGNFVAKFGASRISKMSTSQILESLGMAEQGIGDIFGAVGNPVARQLQAQQQTSRTGASMAENLLKKINVDTIAEGIGKHKGKLLIAGAVAAAGLGLASAVRGSSGLSGAALNAQPVPLNQREESSLNAETLEAGAGEAKRTSFPRSPMPTQLQPRPLQRSLVSIPTKVSVRGRVNEQSMLGSARRTSGRGITLTRRDNRRLSTPEEIMDRLME